MIRFSLIDIIRTKKTTFLQIFVLLIIPLSIIGINGLTNYYEYKTFENSLNEPFPFDFKTNVNFNGKYINSLEVFTVSSDIDKASVLQNKLSWLEINELAQFCIKSGQEYNCNDLKIYITNSDHKMARFYSSIDLSNINTLNLRLKGQLTNESDLIRYHYYEINVKNLNFDNIQLFPPYVSEKITNNTLVIPKEKSNDILKSILISKSDDLVYFEKFGNSKFVEVLNFSNSELLTNRDIDGTLNLLNTFEENYISLISLFSPISDTYKFPLKKVLYINNEKLGSLNESIQFSLVPIYMILLSIIFILQNQILNSTKNDCIILLRNGIPLHKLKEYFFTKFILLDVISIIILILFSSTINKIFDLYIIFSNHLVIIAFSWILNILIQTSISIMFYNDILQDTLIENNSEDINYDVPLNHLLNRFSLISFSLAFISTIMIIFSANIFLRSILFLILDFLFRVILPTLLIVIILYMLQKLIYKFTDNRSFMFNLFKKARININSKNSLLIKYNNLILIFIVFLLISNVTLISIHKQTSDKQVLGNFTLKTSPDISNELPIKLNEMHYFDQSYQSNLIDRPYNISFFFMDISLLENLSRTIRIDTGNSSILPIDSGRQIITSQIIHESLNGSVNKIVLPTRNRIQIDDFNITKYSTINYLDLLSEINPRWILIITDLNNQKIQNINFKMSIYYGYINDRDYKKLRNYGLDNILLENEVDTIITENFYDLKTFKNFIYVLYFILLILYSSLTGLQLLNFTKGLDMFLKFTKYRGGPKVFQKLIIPSCLLANHKILIDLLFSMSVFIYFLFSFFSIDLHILAVIRDQIMFLCIILSTMILMNISLAIILKGEKYN